MNKKLSKIISTVLVLSLTASLGMFSVGCKKSGIEKDGKNIEITFWEEDDPANVDVVWDEIIDNFETQNPTVKVNRVHVSIESIRTNFQNAVIGGGGPSLVAGPDDNVGIFGTAKTAADIEEIFSKDFLDTIEPDILNAARLDGTLYGIPYVTGNTVALLYNKDLVPEAPQTMSELIEEAKRLTSSPDRFGLVFNMSAPYNYIGFLGGFGGEVLNDKNEITLNTEEMKKTIDYLYALKSEHKIMPVECNYDQASNLFKTGDAAFIINGPWSFEEYQKAGINLGITKIPKIDGEDYPTPFVASKVLMLNKNLEGNELEATRKFVEFVCNKENQLKFAPAIREFPTNIEARADENLQEDEMLMSLKEQVDLGVPMPIVPKMRAVWDGMTPVFQEVWTGKLDASSAAAKMQKMALEKSKTMLGE